MASIKATARGYVAEVSGTVVSISRDGVWVGTGRWQSEAEHIVDCAARLGSTDEESEAVYEALDEAIAEATTEPASSEYRIVYGETGNDMGHASDVTYDSEQSARSALASVLECYGDGWGRIEYRRPGGWDRL